MDTPSMFATGFGAGFVILAGVCGILWRKIEAKDAEIARLNEARTSDHKEITAAALELHELVDLNAQQLERRQP